MYLIDPEGTLIYAGAITDDRNFTKGTEATNYIVEARDAVRPVSGLAQRRPWGCGVKYAGGGSRRGGRRGGGRRGGKP